MRKYDSYKDSGIEWIGKVPIGWNLKKLKELFENRNEKNEDLCEDFLSITKDRGVIPYSEKGNVGNKTSEDIGKYKKVYPEDIVVNPMNIIIGSVGVSKYHGVLSNIYIVLKPTKILSGYGSYIFHHKSFQLHLKKICYGIMELRESLNKIEFFVEKLPLPPLSEQSQIVQVLDEKTSLIDSLIEKTKRKIELLKEERTSLINHTVTKGLNPNVELRESGVDWIGEIPSHWKLMKYKHHSEIVTGNTPSKVLEELYYTEKGSGFPWIKPSNLDKGFRYVCESEEDLTEEGKIQTRLIPKDSIMICSIGNTLGKYGISGREVSTNQQINSVVCYEKTLFPRFCLFFTDVLTWDLINRTNFVTLPIFTKTDLENTEIIIPPLSEQQQIVSYLDEHTQLIDKTISVEKRRIDTLKEYRQSLISEVVTGKIKVVLMISYEEFLNKLMNCSGEKNLKVLLVKMYQSILSGQMIFINTFIHKCIVRDNKNISLEDYVSGLLEHFNEYKVRYFKRVKEIENGGLWGNIGISERDHLNTLKEFIEIIDDYLDFVDMTKNIKNIKITPLEFLEKFINKVNSFSITRKSSPEDLYRYLDFDWVESFGYDDGIHDVVNNYKGYWSNEHKLGFITYPKVIEHFDEKYLFELRLVNLKDSLNKHSF